MSRACTIRVEFAVIDIKGVNFLCCCAVFVINVQIVIDSAMGIALFYYFCMDFSLNH